VKEAILKAYALVTEAYRKGDDQIHVDFACEK
jgi:hypothetical protein